MILRPKNIYPHEITKVIALVDLRATKPEEVLGHDWVSRVRDDGSSCLGRFHSISSPFRSVVARLSTSTQRISSTSLSTSAVAKRRQAGPQRTAISGVRA